MRKFIGVCRLIVFHPEQCSKIPPKQLEKLQLTEGQLPPISIQNEAETWKYIKTILENALEEYPTTLREDIKLLKKD